MLQIKSEISLSVCYGILLHASLPIRINYNTRLSRLDGKGSCIKLILCACQWEDPVMVGYTKRAGIIIIIIESTKYVLDIFTFFVKHWWNYDKSCLSQWRMRRVFHSFMPHAAVHQEMIRCTPLGVQSVFLQTATIFIPTIC